MKILILYYSRTGATRALAEAVAEGVAQVEGVTAALKQPDDVTPEDFSSCDGMIVGSPVYFGGMAAELKKTLDDFVSVRKKMEGKPAAAFATSAHHTGGKETTIFSILQALLIYGMIVMGDPIKSGGHYGVACAGAPGPKDFECGRSLGRRVAETALKLRG